MTAQSPGLCPHFRRHQQQGKRWEEEGAPDSCPVPLSQTGPSWVGQKMENIFNKTRWEEALRLWATSGLEEPALSCSGCFWGGCPLPSSNKSQGFLAVRRGGEASKAKPCLWGAARKAGRSMRGELGDGSGDVFMYPARYIERESSRGLGTSDPQPLSLGPSLVPKNLSGFRPVGRQATSRDLNGFANFPDS